MAISPDGPSNRKIKIRNQVQLIVLVIMLIFYLIGSLGIWFFIYQTEQTAWMGRQSEAAENAANTISKTLQRVKSALFWLGNFGDLASLEDPVVVRTFQSRLPELNEFAYLDRDGNIITSATLDNEIILTNSINITDLTWFTQAKDGETFIGDLEFNARNEPFLIVSAPVLRNGNILAVRLRMNVLWGVVEQLRFGDQGRVYIIDQGGMVIAHTDEQIVLSKTNLLDHLALREVINDDNHRWSGEYINFQGQSVAGVSVPIEDTAWTLVSEVPTREVYENTILAASILTVGLIAFALFLMPVLLTIIDRLLVKPLRMLISGSESFGKGNLDLRIPVMGVVEFDELGESFNKMASALNDRDTALKIQYNALQREIEDRQKAEEALRQLNLQLESRVEERTQELLRSGTQLMREMEERERLERRYQNLVERMPAVSYVANIDSILGFNFISPQILHLTGWNANECVQNSNIREKLIHPDDLEEVKRDLKLASEEGQTIRMEYRIVNRMGNVVWVEDHASPLFGLDNRIESYQGVLLDITVRKNAESELIYNAYHDSLTGLFNRTKLIERLNQIIENRKIATSAACFGFLFMDLDRFKIINDSLGHRTGDLLLIETARRLEAVINDSNLLSRLSGDEFVILVEGNDPRKEAIQLSDRLMNEFRAPFVLDGRTVFTTISMGVVIDNGEYTQPEDVLRDADIAMYRAKARGRACYEVFSKPLLDQIINRHQIEALLRDALARNEFNLYFQPIVTLKDNRITGFEALIRWITPTLGMVQPSDFISLAEETGLIKPIDRWVMREACRQVAEWQKKFAATYPFSVSVNLSGSLLQQGDVVEMIREILEETNISPACLKIELTESVFLETSEMINEQLRQIRDIGVQLQIDDFGTGYSSLAYLQRFPITAIKIDRSFIGRIDAQFGGTEIVQAVIALAKELGLETIAEGIETLSQLRWLKEAGCEFGQGYLLYKPMDAQSTESLLGNLEKNDPVVS